MKGFLWAMAVAAAGLAGQGMPTPAKKDFNGHAVVVKGNTIYDPSYGEKYTGVHLILTLHAWEEASIFGFWTNTVTEEGSNLIRPNPDGFDTEFGS